MRLIPFVAVVSGLFYLVEYFTKSEEAIKKALPGLSDFETKALAVANTATRFHPILNIFRLLVIEILNAVGAIDLFNQARAGKNVHVPSAYDQAEARRMRAQSDALTLAYQNSKITDFVIPDFTSLLDTVTPSAPDTIPAFDTSALDEQQKALTEALKTANDDQSEALNKELEILQSRKNAYESFTDAVKTLFGQIKDSILSSFNLPTLGNSVNSITRNISKLLERTKGFARSISQLSGMGLNSALLQQVI
jgi:uncharacterized protein with beta-barrel porin domain